MVIALVSYAGDLSSIPCSATLTLKLTHSFVVGKTWTGILEQRDFGPYSISVSCQ